MLGVADHPVVKTGTNSQQHVAVLHRLVGFDRAVHAEHAEEFAVAGRVGAQAHQRVRDRVAEQVDQGAQFGRGVRQQHAAAGVDVGALGRQQQLQGLADLAAMALAHRVVGAHFHRRRVAGVGGLVERHVLGNVDHHRAGAAAAGDVEGLLHDQGQIAHVLDQEVVLDHRTRDADGVAFLERILTDGRGGHLASDDHHRNAVHVRGGNACYRIGSTRARRDKGYAHITCGTCITIGGVHCSLLMAHQNVLNRVLLVERVVNVQYRTAGIAPDEFDVLGLQGLHEDFGPAQFLGVMGGCCCCRSEFGLGDFHVQPL